MLGKLIVSFLISASPFGEMKIGLPFALHSNINDVVALIFCIAGNLMVYPIVDYLMVNYGARFFKSNKIKRKAVWIKIHTKSKTKDLVNKYGFWGLMLFVMVPIPGTGAYLGTVAAYVFDIDKAKAFKAISIGVVLSGILLYAAIKGALEGFHLLF
jgi:uncharacterized membrane protein